MSLTFCLTESLTDDLVDILTDFVFHKVNRNSNILWLYFQTSNSKYFLLERNKHANFQVLMFGNSGDVCDNLLYIFVGLKKTDISSFRLIHFHILTSFSLAA
jgi:hypothetical protein